MTQKKGKLYTILLWITFALLIIGAVMYVSASLGMFARDPHRFTMGIVKHLGLGAVGGLALMFFIVRYIPTRLFYRYAYVFYGLSILLTALVFIPGIGFAHGGAKRWISLGFISFQPVEFLKIGVIFALAHWLVRYREKIRTWKGFLIYLSHILIPVVLLVKQPDTSSIILIFVTALVLAFVWNASWSQLLGSSLLGLVLLGAFAMYSPYIQRRIDIFLHPDHDPLGAGFQARQAKAAIGSGELFGLGLGRSAHKFGSYLPESSSDSIFAVYAEEFGFVGSVVLIVLYLAFLFFGIRTAKRARNAFDQTIVFGLTFLIVFQSLLNIATISGIIPLSGFPLIFMSGGGTALLVSLFEVGIILSVAKRVRRRNP